MRQNDAFRSRLAQEWYFALTIFLSAFLLFQIQPMISKYILPWFGGSTAVWTTAMLFFQVLLLGGYAYAHYLSRFSVANQVKVHLVVLGGAILWIAAMALTWETPITPGASWKPTNVTFPIVQVLGILAAGVGIPYFLLSTTSSLVQSWFSHMRHQASPYSFYVLSNTASLIALLSYPVLFEPNLLVKEQARLWSAGFLLYGALLAFTAFQVLRRLPGRAQQKQTAEQPAETIAPVEQTSLQPPSVKMYLFWISLAACPSVMLLATTNQMCQDIASIPFLWVLPLSLYLLSFIIAFNDHQKRLRGFYILLTIAALFLGLYVLAYGNRTPIWFQIGSNSLLLFVVCLLCHSELYLRRPNPRYLTSFYLMLSVGGAVGGLFVNLVAPLIFKDFWEYNLGLIYCAVIAIVIAYQNRASRLYRFRIPISVLALSAATFIILLPVLWMTHSEAMYRNFYGVLKIREMDLGDIRGHDMLHGAIVHGSQASEAPYRYQAMRYYSEGSGVALAIQNYPGRKSGQAMRVGLIGLGAGTLAAYGQSGDVYRFYEIDPDVVRAAQDARYFSYLSDSKARTEVVLGDGRLSLENELRQSGSQKYDYLVIDAFSGDSVPVHLLSKEAVGLYLAHLNEKGVLAFNVTNRHINLESILALASDYYHLQGIRIENNHYGILGSYSAWVLLTRDQAWISQPQIQSAGRPLVKKPGIRLWTDDYSNLFQILW